MQVSAHMDLDVIAVEQEDQVTLMLELVAPAAAQGEPRAPATVQIVLDRSGSMGDGRLEAAKQALVRLIDRLDPADRFGLVAFDDEVTVVVPAGELSDKASARAAVAVLGPGGQTNLSAGLLRGFQEARRVAGDTGATALLLSDGHANSGETSPTKLSAVAAHARAHGVTTSTVGIGLGYDELLLAELARGGQGNHAFAEHADGAAAAVAGEVEGLLSKTVQAVSMLIRPEAAVGSIKVWNDLPGHGVQGGVMVEVGDLWAGERRTLLISFDVPARAELGLARIAELELRYVTLPDLVEETITLPVHVNVVPGDQATGRIADPVVRTELVYQQAQGAKRHAAEALRAGDARAGSREYEVAVDRIDLFMAASPSPELAAEREILDDLRARTDAGETQWAAKMSRAEQARKSRTRGRGV